MKRLYRLAQCLWGMPQTLLGLCVYALHRKQKHYAYHGAWVTEWDCPSSVSLGLFVFVTRRPYFAPKFEGIASEEELSVRLLVHEYGHTVQSLLLGPLYLILMGIPSTVWGFWPSLAKWRREKRISYFSFFTERWANALGEWATHEKSMEQWVID